MNNATHTPGPWKAVQHPCEHKWAWTIEGADGVVQSIARMGLVNDAQAVAANARLIAAAPAMYAESKTLCSLVRDFLNDNRSYDGQLIQAIHNLEAALAQAEGRDK